MTKEITYEEATEKINNILKELEAGDIGIDSLQSKVKEAYDLLAYCQEKLRDIDASLKSISPRDTSSDQ